MNPAGWAPPAGTLLVRPLPGLCVCGHLMNVHGDRAVAACAPDHRPPSHAIGSRRTCPCSGYRGAR